jgi:hypothetical protein
MIRSFLTILGGAMNATTKKTGRRALVLVVLGTTMAFAAMAAVGAEVRAGSFDQGPPRAVLMKSTNVLQEQTAELSEWTYWDTYWDEDGQWITWYPEALEGEFPRADVVGAGRRLHIRLNKPQRPEFFTIDAYRRVEQDGFPTVGEGRRLNTTFRSVERDGKTVGWNVFFRVNQPDRHYYLEALGSWKEVPGTHISHGHALYLFHVKTR